MTLTHKDLLFAKTIIFLLIVFVLALIQGIEFLVLITLFLLIGIVAYLQRR